MDQAQPEQTSNQTPNLREFDLLWLTTGQISTLIAGQHHGPLDSQQQTGTRINVFQQAVAIGTLIQMFDRPAVQARLHDLHQGRRTRFELTDQFRRITKDTGIPFDKIDDSTYEDSILNELLRKIGGNPEKIAGHKEKR